MKGSTGQKGPENLNINPSLISIMKMNCLHNTLRGNGTTSVGLLRRSASFALITLFSGTLTAQTVIWDVGNPNDNWNTTDNNWFGSATFANGYDANFNAGVGETVTVDAGGVSPNSTSILDGSWRFDGGSILGGTLIHSSGGTTVLTQANGFSALDLSNGVLRIQDAGALGTGTLTHSGGQLYFSFGDGSNTVVGNNMVLDSTGHQTFVIRGTDGAAPTTETTVRLTGVVSGGTAGQTYRLGDTGAGGNMNNYLILDNAANSFEGTVEVFRGYVGVTSDGALGNTDNDIRLAVGGFNGGLRFADDNIELDASRTITFAASDVIDVGDFTATIHGDLVQSGTRTFQVNGTGTLVLTGASSVSGTNVSSGATLQVGDGGTTGALGSGIITNNGTLVFDRSNAFNLNNRIDGGTGEIIVRGGGVMTMAASTDVKNNALTIEEGGVITQKTTRYFAIGHLVGGSGLPNGATITIEDGAFMSIDANRNLDGDVNYGLGARGNVQVMLNGGEMNFLGDASARDNTVGSFTANNGGSVTVEANHRLDLNNSGGITTTGNGAMTVGGAGSLNLAIRNSTGDEPVFNVGADAPLTINTDITSINVGNSVGGLGLEKTGAGTLTLGGTNTYAGDTLVSGGTLLANGSLTSNVSVSNGATLGGSGSVGDTTINFGGILAAGNSAGTLSTGDLSMNSGSTLDFEFGFADSDRIDVSGDLSLGGATLSLTDLNTGSLTLGDSLTLIGYTGNWDGSTFSGLANAGSFNAAGYDWQIAYDSSSAGSLNGGSGGEFVTLTVIPEPSTFISMLVGLITLGIVMYRRKHS